MKATCVTRVGNNADGAMNPDEQYESPINTRRHQRYELETELTANIRGVERREVMRGRSLNINEGGIGGLFTTGWDVGTSVDLQFSVPIATTPVRVRAVVRNRTSYRYGFEFVNLTPEQRETISRTCRTLELLQ
jgi:c-di-GMP-binding flagellar brake protein YcgR